MLLCVLLMTFTAVQDVTEKTFAFLSTSSSNIFEKRVGNSEIEYLKGKTSGRGRSSARGALLSVVN
jgi:hypothetical protein